MSPRLGLVVFPLLASATAYAQAPGEIEPTYAQPPPPVVAPAPVPVDPCAGGIDPMRHRIAVGLNLGGMTVTQEADDGAEATETGFRTTELSIRYRATPRFEIELLLSGGRQVLEDDSDGDLAMGGGTLAARWRFRPHRPWNWWLMAGIGATVIEHHEASEDARSAATRGHVALGIGLERRFRRLALHADFRIVGLGPRDDAQDDMTLPADPDDGRNPLPPRQNDVRYAEELSAGQFTLGASLYF